MAIDDIIGSNKSELLNENILEKLRAQINALMCYNFNPKDSKELATQINSSFYDLFACGYFSIDDHPEMANSELTSKLSKIAESCVPLGNVNSDAAKVTYSFIPYKRGVFIIYSVYSFKLPIQSGLCDLLSQAGFDLSKIHLGVSIAYNGTENMGFALKESVFANTACILNKKPLLNFAEIGQDRFLMPTRFDPWVERYCHHIDKKLYPHSIPQKCDVTKTLEAYVESGGDIGLTAKLTCQHSNTIRYRLCKIRKILGMEDELNFYSEIYTYIRLLKMRPYLEPFFRSVIR